MKLVRVGAAVLNQVPLDWDGNQHRIVRALEAARQAEVSILCLPELCITGYGCEDMFLAAGTLDTAWELLQELLPLTRGMIVCLGLPVLHTNAVFNTVCLVCDGQILGFVAKRHLAGDGIHYEPRWFKAWPCGIIDRLRMGDQHHPIGDLYFDCGGVKIGFEICEEAWVAARPGSVLAMKGIDIILNPSASHFAFSKVDIRRRFIVEGSRAFGVAYVYANLLGNEAGRAIYDGGAMIAAGGRILARGPRFSFQEVLLTTADVDVALNRMGQARTSSYRPDLGRAPDECVSSPFSFPFRGPHPSIKPETPPWEKGLRVKHEEFARAIPLALFDYLRKSRSRGFVVSLSGGADSAAVACLVALAVQWGVAELGLEGFKARLAYIPALATAGDTQTVIRTLLTCVYQGTKNSTQVTRTAARQVAEAIGADFIAWEIDREVEGYTRLVSKAIGRALSWSEDDLALQNIQARARAPGIWFLANLRQALLLATSNRSEAAVGYATMDGDTCGGVSPIAGIDKHFLREWLRWLETEGPEGLAPLPVLSAINVQQPSAELRPQSHGQTDEADLMPYDVLDFIERAAIRDRRAPEEVFDLLPMQYPQATSEQRLQWVERFFRLWCRNQWKRER